MADRTTDLRSQTAARRRLLAQFSGIVRVLGLSLDGVFVGAVSVPCVVFFFWFFDHFPLPKTQDIGS